MGTRRRIRWTAREDEMIRLHYPQHGCSWTRWRELLPGRTQNQIRIRAGVIGACAKVRGPRKWDEGQERQCVLLLKDMCDLTGREPLNVLHHLEYMIRRSKSA